MPGQRAPCQLHLLHLPLFTGDRGTCQKRTRGSATAGPQDPEDSLSHMHGARVWHPGSLMQTYSSVAFRGVDWATRADAKPASHLRTAEQNGLGSEIQCPSSP